MRYVILEGGSPPTLRFVTIGGEGVEKSQFQHYVIYGRPLTEKSLGNFGSATWVYVTHGNSSHQTKPKSLEPFTLCQSDKACILNQPNRQSRSRSKQIRFEMGSRELIARTLARL